MHERLHRLVYVDYGKVFQREVIFILELFVVILRDILVEKNFRK